jgi:hypothetical protein
MVGIRKRTDEGEHQSPACPGGYHPSHSGKIDRGVVFKVILY